MKITKISKQKNSIKCFTVTCSQNSKQDRLLKQVKDVVRRYFLSQGFSENEIPKYSFVEVSEYDKNTLRVEVRVELDFDGMVELSEELNPIIEKYDEDAYFDFEEPGIMSAYLRKKGVKGSILNDDHTNKLLSSESDVTAVEDLSIYPKEFSEAYKAAKIEFQNRYPNIGVSIIPNDFYANEEDNEVAVLVKDYDTGDYGKCNLIYEYDGTIPYDYDWILQAFEETAEEAGLIDSSEESFTDVEAAEDLSIYPKSFEESYLLAKNDFMNDYSGSSSEVHIDPDDTSAEDGEICLIVSGIDNSGRSTQGKVYVDLDSDVDYIYQALEETAEAIGMEPRSEIMNSTKFNPGERVEVDANPLGVTPNLYEATIIEPAGRFASKGDPEGTQRYLVRKDDGDTRVVDEYAINRVINSSLNSYESPTSFRYKGRRIKLLHDGTGWAIFDSNGEMEDHGFRTPEDAKDYIDDIDSYLS